MRWHNCHRLAQSSGGRILRRPQFPVAVPGIPVQFRNSFCNAYTIPYGFSSEENTEGGACHHRHHTNNQNDGHHRHAARGEAAASV